MNMQSVLAWGLVGATGAKVYPNQKPEGVSLPAVVYQMIDDPMQDGNHSAGGSIHLSRVQITHIASTYDAMRTLVSQVQTYLEGNSTDFEVAYSDGLYLENKEAEDVHVAQKGYFIQWK